MSTPAENTNINPPTEDVVKEEENIETSGSSDDRHGRSWKPAPGTVSRFGRKIVGVKRFIEETWESDDTDEDDINCSTSSDEYDESGDDDADESDDSCIVSDSASVSVHEDELDLLEKIDAALDASSGSDDDDDDDSDDDSESDDDASFNEEEASGSYSEYDEVSGSESDE